MKNKTNKNNKPNTKEKVNFDTIAKAQIKMYKKAHLGLPKKKHVNKLVLEINRYVGQLNIPDSEKQELLRILAENYIAEVLNELQ